MIFLSIKQAESALRDGRLDEAYELLKDPDVRSHRNGQRLITRLTDALLKRGREHLAARRPREAMTDCAKAERLAGNSPEIVSLRGDAIAAMNEAAYSSDKKQAAWAAIERHMQHGQLSMAERALQSADPDSRVAAMTDALSHRRQQIDRSLARASDALAAEDVNEAVRQLLEARRLGASVEQVSPVRLELLSHANAEVEASLVRGAVDHASRLLAAVQPIAGDDLKLRQWRGVLAECTAAQRWLQRGQLRRVATVLLRLQTALPKAKWIADALAHAEAAAGEMERLEGGPLGAKLADLPESAADSQTDACSVSAEAMQEPTMQPPAAPLAAGALDEGVLHLQLDGLGSYLLTTKEELTLGPISSSRRSDLGLIADPALPQIRIRRSDDEYFVESAQPISVNGKPTTRGLLQHGMRVELSPRCAIRFHRANPASATAVLELLSGRLAGSDARRIVLLDRELIVGPASTAHIAAADLSQPIVLQRKDGRLQYAGREMVTVNRQPASSPATVPLHAPIRIGSLGFILNKAEQT